MKRLYYLTRSLSSVVGISRDLARSGIGNNRLHVLGRNAGVLEQAHVHATTLWEETDIMHRGFVGAMLGLVAGALVGLMLLAAEPFGASPGMGALIAATLFGVAAGAWLGGLLGISTRNHHLEPYLPAVEEGQYLVMVDADNPIQEKAVKHVMEDRHAEAVEAGEESDYSPFF